MQQVAWLLATYSACTSALRPAAYTPARATTRLAATTPSLGLYGDWEPSAGGSYVLEAADGPENAKGVVHFLGGAFVGAGSQLTYRYCLLYTSPSPRDSDSSRMPSSA